MFKTIHMKRIILLILIFTGINNLLLAQGYNIALMAAENTQANRDDVYNKLNATGIFINIDVYNIAVETPSTSTMSDYDAILVWANSQILDPAAFGNNLAAYIEAGGGVVTSMFALYDGNSNAIEGNFATNYRVINPGLNFSSTSMGVTYSNSDHPIINEYVSFDGGSSSFHGTGLSLTSGSTSIVLFL